jgi:YebC/PmpR family DNA-binding regulatory protein
MAGHSQFKNIMHRKGRQDRVRAKLFSKLGREITVAAKTGLPDPDMNPRLRLAVQNAKAQSMPKDNIERAISKATASDSENYEEIRYEGYGPGGIALIIEALSDNRNRTGGAVRAALVKHGGNLGSLGAVSHMFNRIGEVSYPAEVGTADEVLEAAIEAGADDVRSDKNGHVIITSFDTLGTVAGELEQRLGEAESVNSVWQPTITTEVDEDGAASIMKLIAVLEDDDDVQNVFANFDADDEVMARLADAD